MSVPGLHYLYNRNRIFEYRHVNKTTKDRFRLITRLWSSFQALFAKNRDLDEEQPLVVNEEFVWINAQERTP